MAAWNSTANAWATSTGSYTVSVGDSSASLPLTGSLAVASGQLGAPVTLHVDSLAHGWRARRTAATGGVLADFGPDPWTLLECVPGYTNVVASFNAAYAGMMRSMADLWRLLGDDEAAGAAGAEAVVAGLFGFDPSYRTLAGPPPPDVIVVPEIGSLSGLNAGSERTRPA